MLKRMSLLLLLLPVWVLADDVTVSVCQYGNDRYQFAYTGQIESLSFTDAQAYDLDTLQATGYGVRFTVFYSGMSLSIYGYPDVPYCPHEDDAWKPGAPSILIPAPHDGLFWVEIQDAYEHWSRVTDDAHPDGILLVAENGLAELIGSVGQDTDPAHYRLIEVNYG